MIEGVRGMFGKDKSDKVRIGSDYRMERDGMRFTVGTERHDVSCWICGKLIRTFQHRMIVTYLEDDSHTHIHTKCFVDEMDDAKLGELNAVFEGIQDKNREASRVVYEKHNKDLKLKYRCRNCGTVFMSVVRGVPLHENGELLMAGSFVKRVDRFADRHQYHDCNDGEVGVADMVGVVKELGENMTEEEFKQILGR